MDLDEFLELPPRQRWVVVQYPGLANHPLSESRSEEYESLRGLADRHYEFNLTTGDFDAAIAARFGGGCEFEWPKD